MRRPRFGHVLGQPGGKTIQQFGSAVRDAVDGFEILAGRVAKICRAVDCANVDIVLLRGGERCADDAGRRAVRGRRKQREVAVGVNEFDPVRMRRKFRFAEGRGKMRKNVADPVAGATVGNGCRQAEARV